MRRRAWRRAPSSRSTATAAWSRSPSARRMRRWWRHEALDRGAGRRRLARRRARGTGAVPADQGLARHAPAAAVVARREVRHLHPLGPGVGAGVDAAARPRGVLVLARAAGAG